jgi:hypothetical protein
MHVDMHVDNVNGDTIFEALQIQALILDKDLSLKPTVIIRCGVFDLYKIQGWRDGSGEKEQIRHW